MLTLKPFPRDQAQLKYVNTCIDEAMQRDMYVAIMVESLKQENIALWKAVMTTAAANPTDARFSGILAEMSQFSDNPGQSLGGSCSSGVGIDGTDNDGSLGDFSQYSSTATSVAVPILPLDNSGSSSFYHGTREEPRIDFEAGQEEQQPPFLPTEVTSSMTGWVCEM